jgi:hypothetical protein
MKRLVVMGVALVASAMAAAQGIQIRVLAAADIREQPPVCIGLATSPGTTSTVR